MTFDCAEVGTSLARDSWLYNTWSRCDTCDMLIIGINHGKGLFCKRLYVLNGALHCRVYLDCVVLLLE